MEYFDFFFFQNLAAAFKPAEPHLKAPLLQSGTVALPAQDHPPGQLSQGVSKHNPLSKTSPAIHPQTSILTKHHSTHKQSCFISEFLPSPINSNIQ